MCCTGDETVVAFGGASFVGVRMCCAGDETVVALAELLVGVTRPGDALAASREILLFWFGLGESSDIALEEASFATMISSWSILSSSSEEESESERSILNSSSSECFGFFVMYLPRS